MTFNEFLVEERWSVARISKELNLNEATVTKWKYEGVIPRKEEMIKIYNFTDGKVTPNDFYGVRDTNPIRVVTTEKVITRERIVTEKEVAIGQWHRDRNLIDGSTDKDQYMKLIQEAGELSDSLCKGKDIRDDIGDMMVVLINIMVRNNLTMNECLSVAYDDIKDRKGKMIDGIFVKEGDE